MLCEIYADMEVLCIGYDLTLNYVNLCNGYYVSFCPQPYCIIRKEKWNMHFKIDFPCLAAEEKVINWIIKRCWHCLFENQAVEIDLLATCI